MKFGDYLKNLRVEKNLNQRQLGELSKVSNTEISRIESGERQTPSAEILKKLAPYLGVSYGELLTEAGYLSEEIEHDKYTEHIFRATDGTMIDILKIAKEIQEKDSELLVIMNRATDELPDSDIAMIKSFINLYLDKKKDK